jgi:hypothetical protein
MSNTPEAQRIAAVRKLTSELYVLQDRMNQTVDQITSLLHGADLGQMMPLASAATQAADGALEHVLRPSAMSLPLPSVFVNNPPSGFALGSGGECKLYGDYKNGQLQVVQVPASRGSDARFGIVFNYANFDATFMSLVYDARSLLAGLPVGKLRVSMAIEYKSEPQAKLHAKFAFKIGENWGEHQMQLKGGRVLVDSFEVPMVDPTRIEALDFHLIFSPGGRGCIELHRATFTVSVVPSAEAVTPQVFESAN